MSETVLCLNAGSSSLKFQLYAVGAGDSLSLRFKGQLEGVGVKPHLAIESFDGSSLADEAFDVADIPDARAAVPTLLLRIRPHLETLPIVVGHRVVFGGVYYASPVRIDASVLEQLNSLVPMMPLHLPPELAAIQVIRERLPDMPQVAVFDTGFHRGHEEIIERLPLPEEFHQEGLRRYGFHGISYEYLAKRLPEVVAPDIAKGRVVAAHLGSGCSMCAMVDGRSVETTMGFSALDGIPMGTRPGRLDPGALLYLFQVKKMTVEQVERLLYGACGLKGISGISNDVRELLASESPGAKMALEYFSLHCARAVADLTCVMGGIDGLVFTAGVGECAAPLRAAIGARLNWLGVHIDASANIRHGPRISSDASRVACYVIPTNEELMIAQHSLRLFRSRA